MAPVPFIDLVTTSATVATRPGRLEKTDALASLLARLDPGDVPIAMAFLSGTPVQGRIGIGWSVLQQASEAPAAAPTLTLADVDRAFAEIASLTGAGSAVSRRARLGALFSRATEAEQDFLRRLIFGELRQGALEGVLLDAVARASRLAPALVRRAAMMTGNPGLVARTALEAGAAGLEEFGIEPMRPVDPMLADSAETIDEAIARLGRAAFEWKLDGARVQAHKSGGEVRVFSRNLRDVSAAVPEVIAALSPLPADRLILDGEVLALRPDGTPHPFQVTMRRFGRRLGVERLRHELPVTPFFFDCLLTDHGAVVDWPQRERFAALERAVPASLVIPHLTTADVHEARAFLDDALRRGHEGVVAKALDAPYAAGRRGQGWIKIKQARTLDLVVLAAEWGSGRRKGWLSNLHLGARLPADASGDRTGGSRGFVMLGKTFKGLTDEMLRWQTARLLELETHRDAVTVFVRPELVVEIAFNDLQVSPHYPGRLALRFARVKGYRPDKRPGDADTFAAVQALYTKMTGDPAPPAPL